MASNAETDWIEVPEVLHSPQTYEFIGFKEHNAREIWQRFLNMPTGPNEFEADFLDMALAHIDGTSADALDESDDWFTVMDAIGVNANVQQAIMDPEFKSVRLTETLKHWLKETATVNFNSLEALDERIRKNVGSLNVCKTSDQKLNEPSQEAEKPTSSKAPIAELSTCTPIPTFATDVAVPKSLPGHVTLWKALDRERCNGFVRADGSLDMSVISSSPPSDFSNLSALFYFTPQRECAEHYAGYLRRRCPTVDITIIQLMISEELIAELKPLYLMYDDLWKEVVWYSRRGALYPKALRQLLWKQGLIIGNIAHNHDKHFSRMQDWKQITEASVLHIDDGQSAIQYAFMKETVAQQVADHCKDKVWLYKYGPRLLPISKP
jgi:hypothetical protein